MFQGVEQRRYLGYVPLHGLMHLGEGYIIVESDHVRVVGQLADIGEPFEELLVVFIRCILLVLYQTCSAMS